MANNKPNWGNSLMIISVVLFIIGYFALLLTVVQNHYITENLQNGTRNLPPLVPWVIIGLIDGFLLGAGTNIGFNLSKEKTFNTAMPKFTWSAVLQSKSFWGWCFLCAGLVLLFTMLWRNGNI